VQDNGAVIAQGLMPIGERGGPDCQPSPCRPKVLQKLQGGAKTAVHGIEIDKKNIKCSASTSGKKFSGVLAGFEMRGTKKIPATC
jgi:hypothetical protein